MPLGGGQEGGEGERELCNITLTLIELTKMRETGHLSVKRRYCIRHDTTQTRRKTTHSWWRGNGQGEAWQTCLGIITT